MPNPATLGDKIYDDPIGAAALMHHITPHFCCWLAQADVFCGGNTDGISNAPPTLRSQYRTPPGIRRAIVW
jgi:hypothetical protein